MCTQKINGPKKIFGWLICIFKTIDGSNKMDYRLFTFTFIYGEKKSNSFKHCSLTFSYTPWSMKCDSRASFLAHTFVSLYLSRKPKARVVIKMDKVAMNNYLFRNHEIT